jgi:hypothetical protein
MRDRIGVVSGGKEIFPESSFVAKHQVTLRYPCPRDKIQFLVYSFRSTETAELNHVETSPAPAADQGL